MDSEVKVSFSELVFDRASDTFDTTATITNISEEVLVPPISLVLITIVPNSVSLANTTGHTPEGNAFVAVPMPASGLAPGESISDIRLKFTNPAQGKFTFTHAIARPLLPIADAGPDISAKVSMPVTIDGSNSHGPDPDPGALRESRQGPGRHGMDARSRAAEDDSAERADHPNKDRLITFNWTIAEAPEGSVAKLDASQPAPLFVPDLPGVYVLRLVVTAEGKRDSLPDRMTLTAFEENAAPNARVGRDRSVLVGAPVDLDGNQSYDPEDTPLAFHWSLVSAPKGSELTDSALSFRDTATPQFTPEVAGTHRLRLRVSDGESTAEDRVRVTAIAGDLPPTADAGMDQRVRRARLIRLRGTASVDPDAAPSPLDFSWSLVARPASSALTRSAIRGADTATPNFTPDVEGTYLFRLKVSDGEKSDADNVLVLFESNRSPNAVDATSGPIAIDTPGGSFTMAGGRSFALSVAPNSISLSVGEEGAFRVTLRGKLTSPAPLSVRGLPRGATASFALPTLTAGQSTKLTVRASATTPVGTFSLLISATAFVNGVHARRSASVTLRVRSRVVGQANAVICPGVDVAKLSALYVSPQGSDAGFCGVGAPCKTIAYALQVADYFGYRAVVLQHGLYQTTETIDLKDGVSLYGSCLFDGEPDKYRTVIQANPAPGTPAILASGVNVTVSGVVVIGKDETANGAASVAMTAANANVTLRGTVFVAGNGGPGASRPPVQSRAAVRGGNDPCFTPGGGASDLLWGQVDLGNFAWVAGIGGAGSGAGVYVTGPGGVGGQQGGASIGLLLVNSAVVTTVPDEFNRIVGGFGGVGGAGQAGPSFGLGGGANNGGAGGNGGPSIGVASINSASIPSGGAYIYANAPGGPGAGGAAGVDPGQCQGDPGADGVKGGSATEYQFPIPNTLTPGESLAGGQSLYSPNLRFQLILFYDSNLCLYSAGNALWCSQTQGQGIYQAIMQSDGNFCMYETAGQFLPICSGSAGHPGARLTVQDSGHAQVVDTSGAVLWSVP